jgi:uncharacterized protein YjbI with pentapeptide repeats
MAGRTRRCFLDRSDGWRGLAAVDLTNADFSGADLRKANFRLSKLDAANFEDAIFDSQTTWLDGFDPIKAGAHME